MKKRKFFAMLLMLAMFIGCLSGAKTVKAEMPFIMNVGKTNVFEVMPGRSSHFAIPVQLSDYRCTINYGTAISVSVSSKDGLFEKTQGYLTEKGDGVLSEKAVPLTSTKMAYVEFDLLISDSAKIGTYEAELEFTFQGYRFTDAGDIMEVTSATLPFNLRITKELAPVQLIVENFSYDVEAAVIGGSFDLSYEVTNGGEIKAYNTFMSIDYTGSGIVPDYSLQSVRVGDLKPGDRVTQSFPVSVLPNTEPGMKTITVQFKYKDVQGTEYEESRTVYVMIERASANPEEDAQLIAETTSLNDIVPADSDYKLIIQLENAGVKTARNITVQIPEEGGGIGASHGILPNYPVDGMKVENVKPKKSATVEIPLVITSEAAAGLQELIVQVDYENSKGMPLTATVKAYITILSKKEELVTNDVVISDVVQTPEQPVAGEVVTLDFKVTNNGNRDIRDLVLYGEDFSNTGFEPLEAEVKHFVGNLAQGASQEVTMHFRVGSQISEGMNQLKLAAAYVDAKEEPQQETTTIYVLNVKQVTAEEVKNSITISNIAQTPEAPLVGENVTVTFTVTNNGTKGITGLKFAGSNLGSSNFEPISSEIYTVVGDIAANASKKVSMTFKVGEEIPEGFNTLSLEYIYVDGKGDVQTEGTSFYVLNVKNASAANTSKPKLIVSEFSTNSKELRAGSTFDFSFALKNTHATKAAKNIKVTVLQKEGIFAPTAGSNSFYIDSIAPGEECVNVLNMKVRSDTATGAYEISIQVEYEYDDMSQTDAAAGGVTDENIIRLQAVENARPAVQNLMVGYSWDTPTVNQATTLSFNFYNMGKSTLDNVYITLSGDYSMEMGTMQIIGSVSAGSSSYQEISILPLMEGMCNGILTVHFEDSNGDEVTKDFELPETYVQGDYSTGGDMFIPDIGWDEPVIGGDVAEVKEPLMPVWAYVVSLAAALLLGMVVTRAIVIKRHKAKLWAEEDV